MKKIIIFLLIISISGLFPGHANMMSSTHYQINTDSINVGGAKQTSANYKGEDTIGEIATGNATSTHYGIAAGYQAMWDYLPGVSFAINSNTAALGILTTLAASTASTSFSVSSNAINGYVVEINGNTLTSDVSSDNIDALASPTGSSPGAEQFGINLVDNSTPDVGANPVGGQGTVASNYNTANLFKFVSGNTIASSNIYSKTTTFTISYLANISSNTVASNYLTNLTLLATAKFYDRELNNVFTLSVLPQGST